MAIGIYFAPTSLSSGQYDEVIRELEEAGAGAPAGRTYHCAFESGDGIHVFDVWDSQESFDAFGQTMLPMVERRGVDVGRPTIAQVHNIIVG